MSYILELEPQGVWAIFEQITKVPRPSKREGKITAWLVDFAKEHSLEWRRDKIGNVVICKEATEGFESRPTVVLQSHVDMVCEKNSDVDFNFDTDPIKAYIDEGWVTAEGTTLGADCGIGMAVALALLIDPQAEHGALEALFTVDEETGLTGAFELEESMITGEVLINLDSQDEGELFIGCAGGIDTLAIFRYREVKTPSSYSFFRVDVTGLQGGHSGDDIGKGRANANKIICRLLLMGQQSYDLRLSYLDGGNLRNAIPREAYAIFGVPSRIADEFMRSYALFVEDMVQEYIVTEPLMSLSINEMPQLEMVLDSDTQSSLLSALVGVANGVISMSQSVEGLVECSSNLASIKFKGDNAIFITTSQRSPSESSKLYAMQMVESVFSLAGADVSHSDGYPGWSANPSSRVLGLAQRSYRELFGVEAKVKAVHAGLECGLFLERFPALDMISFGPTVRGVHSPDERLEIASVERFWSLLNSLLKRV